MPIVRNVPQQAPVESERTTRSSGNGAGGASAPQRGRPAAAVAGEQGQEVARQARAQTQEVASVAGDQAREVADLVRSQATQLTQELSDQGRTLYEETRQQVAEQADAQTQALAQTLHRWGSEAQALAEGRPADAGTVGMYARQFADQLYRAASEIEMRGASGLVEEVGDLARRRPGTFLLGAALIGFGGGRLLRSGKANTGGTDAMSTGGTDAMSTVTSGAPRTETVARRRAPMSAATGARRNPASAGGE